MGRLLYDLKVVDQRTIDRYKKEAEKMGKSSFALAWVLDQGTEERSRGVTIDIATNKFDTDKTRWVDHLQARRAIERGNTGVEIENALTYHDVSSLRLC